MTTANSYLMENQEETVRLELKTNPEAVRKQARWCGVKPGLRVLDAGCGPGLVTSILHEMLQPGGKILGVDSSKERICYAKQHYGCQSGIDFVRHDIRDPMDGLGDFDLIWVRFLLQYYRLESPAIVRNLIKCLKPGGYLCLIDLDHNSLNFYDLPHKLENIIFKAMKILEQEHNFDPYAGRKLYSYLYDLGYVNIRLELMPHHLIYGKMTDEELFNWTKKMEVGSRRVKELFEEYPGGSNRLFSEFLDFLNNPRRFLYTPLILCKGANPSISLSKSK